MSAIKIVPRAARCNADPASGRTRKREAPWRAWLALPVLAALGGCQQRPFDASMIDGNAVMAPSPYLRQRGGCPGRGAWMGSVQGAAGGRVAGSLVGEGRRGAAIGTLAGGVSGVAGAAESCPP